MAINMTKAFYTHKCNETVPNSLWNSHLLGWKQFKLNNHFNQPGTLEGIDFAHLFAWWPPICAHVTHDSVCSSSMCARVPISILPHYPCPWSRNVTRALWAGKLWWPLAWWPVVTSGDQWWPWRWPGLWSPWSPVFSPPPHTIGCPMARVPTLLTSSATL